jgi:hypothetical protein
MTRWGGCARIGAIVLLCSTRTVGAAEGGEMRELASRHFTVVSSAKAPSPSEIAAHLEGTWQRFHELFDVDPPTVRVVLSTSSGGAQTVSHADQGGGSGAAVIAWTIREGEDLAGQGFSDLSHEIAHIYFLDLMGNPGGLHQTHAWLHEAVACHHESPALAADRERWIRERIEERIPLGELFEMKNPVKLSPLVELTVQLHEQLARGEIDAAQMNQQIHRYASEHSGDLARAGIRNMTYYAQSLSLLRFLLERAGRPFVKTMVARLRDGESMPQILAASEAFPQGLGSLEEGWVAWARTRP